MNFLHRLREKVKKYDDGHNFTCDICGREVFENQRVCAQCKRDLPWNNGYVCPICGRKVGEEGICLECKQKPVGVDMARSVFVHEGEAARLVVRFKKEKRYLYRTLAELMLPLLQKEFLSVDALTFVPMTARAEKKRGYNQSRLLAEELAARCGKPVLYSVEKRKESKPQKTLSRAEREKNLEGCFVADRQAVKGKSILIIDDTFTTGSTVSALSDVLKRAGATGVYALTATSVQYKDPFGIPPKQ
ncbi:MAG: ComF family protein [Clostridia bacterium]|nr:ComF family protein [Clostridia bacterium]